MTPPLRSSGFTENGKKERYGNFRSIILWNDIRSLVLKVTESEWIDAHAGRLRIVAFSAAVPKVIPNKMLGASEQHAP